MIWYPYGSWSDNIILGVKGHSELKFWKLVVGSIFSADDDGVQHFGIKGHQEIKFLNLGDGVNFTCKSWWSSPFWDHRSSSGQILKLWWWDQFSMRSWWRLLFFFFGGGVSKVIERSNSETLVVGSVFCEVMMEIIILGLRSSRGQIPKLWWQD